MILQNLSREAKSSTFPESHSVKKQHNIYIFPYIVKTQNHCLQVAPSLFLILRELLVFSKPYSNHRKAKRDIRAADS